MQNFVVVGAEGMLKELLQVLAFDENNSQELLFSSRNHEKLSHQRLMNN
jgi:hypothetical protein